jgi:L-seryl-tRNA(Ser) seleniumtransferase
VRQGRVPAVIGRVEGGRLLLDLRAVVPADDETLTRAVVTAAAVTTAEPGAAGTGT